MNTLGKSIDLKNKKFAVEIFSKYNGKQENSSHKRPSLVFKSLNIGEFLEQYINRVNQHIYLSTFVRMIIPSDIYKNVLNRRVYSIYLKRSSSGFLQNNIRSLKKPNIKYIQLCSFIGKKYIYFSSVIRMSSRGDIHKKVLNCRFNSFYPKRSSGNFLKNSINRLEETNKKYIQIYKFSGKKTGGKDCKVTYSDGIVKSVQNILWSEYRPNIYGFKKNLLKITTLRSSFILKMNKKNWQQNIRAAKYTYKSKNNNFYIITQSEKNTRFVQAVKKQEAPRSIIYKYSFKQLIKKMELFNNNMQSVFQEQSVGKSRFYLSENSLKNFELKELPKMDFSIQEVIETPYLSGWSNTKMDFIEFIGLSEKAKERTIVSDHKQLHNNQFIMKGRDFSGADIKKLADEVYWEIERKLKSERERRGLR